MGHKHRMFSLFWILWTNCLTFLAVFSLFLVSTRLSIVLAYKLLFISVSVDLQVCLLHYFASFINQFISLLSWSVFYNYLSTKQIVFLCLEPKDPHPCLLLSLCILLLLLFCAICQMMPYGASHMLTVFMYLQRMWPADCCVINTWITKKLLQILITGTSI